MSTKLRWKRTVYVKLIFLEKKNQQIVLKQNSFAIDSIGGDEYTLSFIVLDNIRNIDETIQVFEGNAPSCSINQEVDSLWLVLHKGHVYEKVLLEFRNIICDIKHIHIGKMSPNGVKEAAFGAGGLFRSVLIKYWSTFYMERVKIQIFSHEFTSQKWHNDAKFLRWDLNW